MGVLSRYETRSILEQKIVSRPVKQIQRRFHKAGKGAPVPFPEATPVESSVGGPLRGIQRGTAGQAKTQRRERKEKTDSGI